MKIKIKKDFCQLMLMKRNLRITGDQEDKYLLILFSLESCIVMTNHDTQLGIIKATKAIGINRSKSRCYWLAT